VRTGPEASKPITLRSNENCEYFVDSRSVGRGRELRVVVENAPHEVRCVAEGFRPRVEYANPPFPRGYVLGFTFVLGDRLAASPEPGVPTRAEGALPRVLGSAPPATAPISAALLPPPTVSVEAPAGVVVAGPTATVVISARGSAPIQDVEVRVNGRLVTPETDERTRGLEIATSRSVPLDSGANVVLVAARDAQGRLGHASLSLERRPSARPGEAPGRQKPGGGIAATPRAAEPATAARPTYRPFYRRRLAVVIGIDRYASWPALEGAATDARRVAGKLRELGFDEIVEIYDADATRERILRLLGDELPERTQADDLVVLYFAGHGKTETVASGEKRGWIIPADASVQQTFSTAISMESLRELSNRIPAKHLYYAMDSCYSGLGLRRGMRIEPATADALAHATSLRAVQMITAGAEGEEVIERGGRGLFTTYWLRALDGEADRDADGVVTASEIGQFLPPSVAGASGGRQHPQHGTLEGAGEVVFARR
jgi:hypothetical protein